MLTLRKASDRFHTKIDWLDSWHTFSFGSHYDPKHMGFGPLRVINDDRVMGGGGFPTHPHRDMEIITVVLKGALSHRDSLGTGSTIKPGDVQKMSAGSGILHSEFNASGSEIVHLLQIWIEPDKKGIKPGYQQIHFEPESLKNQLRLVAGPEGKGIITLTQDARLSIADLDAGRAIEQSVGKDRKFWVHLASGFAAVNGIKMEAGDGLAIEGEPAITLAASDNAKALVFDLAS